MHRSRLIGIMIDCSEDTMEKGVRFWSQALGTVPLKRDDPTSPCVNLEGSEVTVDVRLQRVRDRSRVHLDIVTDDLEAEVQRLVKLGARRKEQIESWWVMEDPTGQPFCVAPTWSDADLENARTWDS